MKSKKRIEKPLKKTRARKSASSKKKPVPSISRQSAFCSHGRITARLEGSFGLGAFERALKTAL